MKDCPQKPRDAARTNARGRIFQLDESDAMVTLAIIQGTLFIYNFIARALTDNSAMHSFMPYKFATNLIAESVPLEQTIIVETPSRGLLEARVVYKTYLVKVLSRELTVDLILLDFLGFDIILGMDFLETYRALIDYGDKTVILCPLKTKQS